ncbi:branched-chain amino acid transport system permease protein [Rhodoligotrophos appendicifer]|uniref:branched-chain amino acid ABC transporter permease n=1 Tax=Rhodoligotrophos appendicifer TaxID=987056 RepID=UPI0011869B02|nr:branched-chain amino acid ABC transporter permease [Rhodoligotrophos appendicifer]
MTDPVLHDVVRLAMSALSQGCLYGLVAIGFSLIYNSTCVINFAQGEFVMLGGVLSFAGIYYGLPLALAVLLAIILTTLVGLALQRVIISPLHRRHAPSFSYAFTLFGISVILSNLVLVTAGSEAITVPAFTSGPPVEIFTAFVQRQSLWLIAVSLLVTAGLTVFWTCTLTGKAMRAAAMDPAAARLVGISISRVVAAAYALSATFGAIAGAVSAPIILTGYNIGLPLLVKGFVAAIIGGFGSVFGAMIGGLALALIEAFSSYFISSTYRDVISFVVMILFLLVLPHGLFGRRTGHRLEI